MCRVNGNKVRPMKGGVNRGSKLRGNLQCFGRRLTGKKWRKFEMYLNQLDRYTLIEKKNKTCKRKTLF